MLEAMARGLRVAVAVAVCITPSLMSAQKRFVAPADRTVFVEYEVGYGSTPMQIAYISNLSSV